MPLSSNVVGASGTTFVHEIDARWLMAYAAGLGDMKPCHLDTLRPGGIVGHPLFPVCFEWPVIIEGRHLPGWGSLPEEERIRGVHASHDTVLHRPIRPGDRLATRASIAAVERRKPGAYLVTRLDTTGQAGEAVCTTWYGSLFLGVGVTGGDRPLEDAPEPPSPLSSAAEPRAAHPVSIPENAAHVYTECARIWNPIHTDVSVAQRAGLPGIILHGTATLAHAVSRVVDREAGGDPERVLRIAGRFGAMVLMPSEIVVRVVERAYGRGGEEVRFEVLTGEGKPAVRDGLVVLAG